MENNIQLLPGYRVNEYLLVLRPPEALWNKIVKVKEGFAEAYQATNARWGKPHITLAKFVQYEMLETRIVNRLKIVGMSQYPFKVELRDYGSFPSHTIYINVATKVPVQHLIKQVRSEGQRLMKLNDDNKPHFIMEPHLTVSRNLQPWQYEKAWAEYSNRQFTGRFIADSMLLLKRAQNEMAYQIVQRFTFQNLPVTTKQGELFI
ncbi:2'-5' RNA ligase family protein [Agriterribacter sp.]|uniref:2'-5' RNA ligase family protein n=1 Tax=Agriterribacter sp. TaxID=2821509 RepID=UPI002C40F56F|nr:2'-5' RNA ligase family protein [Agriterribacter sp.]HRO46886.1 2'-5' RNA ligase family protein [Agriterribacter sp.]HRQ18223.1 2'-5' RNA ligase family protein [Agriterribacter sp.]